MSSVCRICLAGNTRLYLLSNNLLIEVYEKLSSTKFHTEDARPQALCCFCYQKLQKCHTFVQMVNRSDKIFTHLYHNGFKATHEYITKAELGMKPLLTVASMQFINIDENTTEAGSLDIPKYPIPIVDIKEEATTERDEWVVVDSVLEDCTNGQIKSEDNSEQGDDVEEFSYGIHDEKTKPDDSKITISCNNTTEAGSREIPRHPIPILDIKEEATTEQDEWVAVDSDLEDCTIGQIIFEEENSDQDDVEELSYGIHEETIPDDSKITISCNNCHKIFLNESQLISHTRNEHSQLKERQQSCSKQYTVFSTSMNKGKIIQNQKKKFVCHICDKEFVRNKNLLSHMQIHTEDSKSKLTTIVSNKKISNKHSLVSQPQTHTKGKKISCSVCDKQFQYKRYLEIHMRNHTGEKPFACNVCDKKFKQKPHVTSHMRIHTGEKPFACIVCDKQFSHKKSLDFHMINHTGAQPFVCDLCKKQYKLKSDLVRHMKTHTGGMPFPCDVCNKSFNQNRDLARHMRMHTGEKPFSCKVCGRKYRIISNLHKHVRITHRD